VLNKSSAYLGRDYLPFSISPKVLSIFYAVPVLKNNITYYHFYLIFEYFGRLVQEYQELGAYPDNGNYYLKER
jgi:hypothetical protein